MKDALHPSLEANLEDLKSVYRILVSHIPDHPELEDNDFLESLRRLLVAQATAEGIDTADEEAWTAWLENETDVDPEGTELN
jgi:hypothetical protein